MRKLLISLMLLQTIFTNNLFAQDDLKSKIKKLNWSGIEVVFIENESFPNYNINIYYSDGALSDSKKKMGITDMMFSQLISGTDRYGQKELADSIEYYGASFSSSVNHEYSTVNMSGLIKDMIPNVKMACHILNTANFPAKEIKKYKKRFISSLKSISENPKGLAERVFREITLSGTKYSLPADGKIKTIKRIKRSDLVKKLAYFNTKVQKRIYITGPKKILELEKVFKFDCAWSQEKKLFERTKDEKLSVKEFKGQKIYLVPIPKSNQAQIRIGRYLGPEFLGKEYPLMDLAATYLGGGFTSRLQQRLRVKEGLTYGVYAYAAAQRNYGRAAVSTSTKNKTVFKIINSAREVITKAAMKGGISNKLIKNSASYLAGSYLFGFEQTSAFLRNLLFLDHQGRSYDELYKFPDYVKSYTATQLEDKIRSIFDFSKQTIVVVGDKSLKKQLAKFGKVHVVNLNNYL
jgi:zinc protease